MAVTDIEATASEGGSEGAKGLLALLPARVRALPSAEHGIVHAMGRPIALAEMQAFVIDDEVPDLVGDIRGIEDRRYPHHAEHGPAESDAPEVVPAGPGEPGVLYIPGLQETGLEEPVDGIGDERVFPDIGPQEIPAPTDENGTAGEDEVLRRHEVDERLRLLPLEVLPATHHHLAEICENGVGRSPQIVGYLQGCDSAADGPPVVEVLLRDELRFHAVYVSLAAGCQEIGQVVLHSSSPRLCPSDADGAAWTAPRIRARRRCRSRTTTWRSSTWTEWG